MTTGLSPANDPAMPIRELGQKVEIFVVDVHRARSPAIDVNRVAFGDFLDVLVPLVAVVAILIRRHGLDQMVSRQIL